MISTIDFVAYTQESEKRGKALQDWRDLFLEITFSMFHLNSTQLLEVSIPIFFETHL